MLKSHFLRAGEKWLSGLEHLIAVTEDLGSVPSTHMLAHTELPCLASIVKHTDNITEKKSAH